MKRTDFFKTIGLAASAVLATPLLSFTKSKESDPLDFDFDLSHHKFTDEELIESKSEIRSSIFYDKTIELPEGWRLHYNKQMDSGQLFSESWTISNKNIRKYHYIFYKYGTEVKSYHNFSTGIRTEITTDLKS